MVVAQSADRSLPEPEDLRSNPVISIGIKQLFTDNCWKDGNKKETTNCQTKISWSSPNVVWGRLDSRVVLALDYGLWYVASWTKSLHLSDDNWILENHQYCILMISFGLFNLILLLSIEFVIELWNRKLKLKLISLRLAIFKIIWYITCLEIKLSSCYSHTYF